MTARSRELIIFDCDGVLVDSEPISLAVLREMLAEAGVEITESRAYRNFLGKSMATITRMIEQEFQIEISSERTEAMRKRLFQRFQDELEPVAGIPDLLASFPFDKCVASSSQPERIRLSLTKTGLIGHFEPHIFSATMVRNGKPAPDLFLHAASAMDHKAADCIVIEDSPAGIRAAQAAGMRVFAFVGGSHAPVSKLRDMVTDLQPTRIFDDMATLPGLIAAER